MNIPDSESFRKNVIAVFVEKGINEPFSINFEKGIFNWTIKEARNRKIIRKWNNSFFVTIYIDKLRSAIFNLSSDLIHQINKSEIKSQQIAFMTHQELNPQKWDVSIQRKMLRDKNKYETNTESSSDSFYCRKCHKNKTTHYQLQTRSADEPMTIFFRCCKCHYQWKEY